MKTKKIILGIMMAFVLFSCSKDENVKMTTVQELKVNAQMDEITDDVSKIVDDQYNIQFGLSGRNSQMVDSFLPTCANVIAVISGTTWTRTVTFTNCTMPNGNVLNGQIIISGSTNADLPSHTINYEFVNFYHNDILITGNRTVTRTLASTAALAAIHPVATMDINMTATFPSGNSHTRVGTRVRELIEGYNTPLVWLDNVYSITGSWTTTFPDGTRTATITNALIVKMNCQHIVQGTINVIGGSNTASIDFGSGICDNIATLTVNGNVTTITLGN